MRAAYLDDLRSKFLLENSVLKMEYAEVRVLHLGHKVGTAVHTFPGPSPCWPSLPPHPLASSCVFSMGSAEALSLVSPNPWLWPQSQVPFWTFFLAEIELLFLQACSSWP